MFLYLLHLLEVLLVCLPFHAQNYLSSLDKKPDVAVERLVPTIEILNIQDIASYNSNRL